MPTQLCVASLVVILWSLALNYDKYTMTYATFSPSQSPSYQPFSYIWGIVLILILHLPPSFSGINWLFYFFLSSFQVIGNLSLSRSPHVRVTDAKDQTNPRSVSCLALTPYFTLASPRRPLMTTPLCYLPQLMSMAFCYRYCPRVSLASFLAILDLAF